MVQTKPRKGSPGLNVRFKPDEMERIKDRASKDFADNASVLVKVAVKRLLDEAEDETTSEQEELAS